MDKVCPDHQMLSVYFDGELPSPWKEKMESHVAGCSQCARRLKTYERISLSSAGTDKRAMELSRERVWHKLEQSAGLAAYFTAWPQTARGRAVWRRSISVPLPAAAAAVVLLVFAFFLAVRATGTTETPDMAIASEADFETPGIIPVSGMNDVLQYLGSRDNGELIILRLPESRSFVNCGEPAIIRAADYSRRAVMPVQTMTGHVMPEWRKH